MSLDDLINRYLDDRSALRADELEALIAHLRAEPARAASVREQLVLDDLLAQKLAVDRRDFPAQVAQRIADFEHGQDELDQQVFELRALAEAEIERPAAWSGSSPWVKYILALSAAAILAGLFLGRQFLTPAPVHVAKVTAVSGAVKIVRSGQSLAAALNAGLLSGQQLVVPAGGSIDITYQDATVVRLTENTVATLDVDRATAAKLMQLSRGELTADIQPQAAAMTFATPHAVATVLGTRLRLQVTADRTQLDVTEGQVQFDRLSGGPPALVAAHQTGIASLNEFRVQTFAWPRDRQTVAYLYSPLETTEEDGLPFMFARNPATGNLRKTDLQPRGAARLLSSLHWQLAGGYLISEEAGPDVRTALAERSKLTLEIVFTSANNSAKEAIASGDQARIVALADDGDGVNFALSQAGSDLLFELRTEIQSREPLRISLASVQQTRHLAITYSGSEIVAYLDGAEVARSSAWRGRLADWRDGPLTVGASARGHHVWQGTVKALALDAHCHTPAEVAHSAASFRLLAGRSR